ncbi:MAG: hypothetical protein IPO92_16545 [Saprospiraceae bacterium]|nr:hypothetical protein [Saprospiraceae bacterium]
MAQYTKIKIIVIFVFCSFLTFNKSSAQCDNTAQWPAVTVNIICGNNTIVSNIFAGEYSVTSGYQDQSTLVFSSSVVGDYITLRKTSDNSVVAAGLSPLTILYFVADGNLKVHINTNVACGTENAARVSSVLMTCGCNNSVKFPISNVSLTQGENTIATNQWAGDYNVTQSYIDGSLCTYASSVATDYITLRHAISNIIIATGISPLTIEYRASYGNIEMHINSNASCGTENINRTTTVTMLNIFNGGNDDGFVSASFDQGDNPILAIFKGGNDDGFVSTSFDQGDNPILAIFKGGNDDGFVAANFDQGDNPILAIFKGGNDDGFVSTSFDQGDNPILAIFKGGYDDGFVASSYEQCEGNKLKWVGNISIDWHTAANWECGILPTLTSDVTIPSGALLFPTVSANDEIKKLTLDLGSSIIILPPAVLKLNGL